MYSSSYYCLILYFLLVIIAGSVVRSREQNEGQAFQNTPILIWWTEQSNQWQVSNTQIELTCGKRETKCLISENRNLLKDPKTRGILFYGGVELKPDDLPLPRHQRHEWALFYDESPLNNYIFSHNPFIRLFNHTATFTRFSDFPLTLHFVPNNDYFTRRKPVPLTTKNKLKREKNLASVVYIQSHCEVPSDRDRYIQELMKYIKIDSYGKCLKNKDIPTEFEDPVYNLNNPDEFYNFMAQYKFHIAFENAICEDYITEKLMRPLHLGSIPIYKGSPSAQDWMPSNKSIILADQFESPKELAQFIQQIDDDDSEYESYLNFKKDGISNQRLKSALQERDWRVNEPEYPLMRQSFECFVCEKISERIDAEKKGIELPPKIADRSHLGCGQPYTTLIDPSDVPKGDTWWNVDWIEIYWQAFDDALTVAEMLRRNETDPRSFRRYQAEMLRKRYNGQ